MTLAVKGGKMTVATKPKKRTMVDPLTFLLEDLEERATYLREIVDTTADMHFNEKSAFNIELDGLEIDIIVLKDMFGILEVTEE